MGPSPDSITIRKISNRCSGPRVPCEGALFQQVEVLPRQRSSRPGSYPSSHGGTEVAEAWETRGGFRPSVSWQAVTRVNTEAAPKDTMRRTTPPGPGEGWYGSDAGVGRQVRSASPGWWVTACQQGTSGNTGSPSEVAGDRLGHQTHRASGRRRVAEGLVVVVSKNSNDRKCLSCKASHLKARVA